MGSALNVGGSTLSRCLGPVLTGGSVKADVPGSYLVYCGNNSGVLDLF